MLSTSSMLSAITQKCYQNQLATQELGDLLDDEKIRSMDERATKIINVRTFDSTESLSFDFSVVEQKFRSFWFFILLAIVTACLQFGLQVLAKRLIGYFAEKSESQVDVEKQEPQGSNRVKTSYL